MTIAKPSVQFNVALHKVTGGTGPVPAPSRHPGAGAQDAGAAPRADIRLSLHEDLGAVAEEWRMFEKRADYTPFQTFEWLAAWQRHIGVLQGVRPAIIFARRRDGVLLFVLPLAVGGRGLVRRLTWLGADLADYNAPLLSPDFSRTLEASQFAPLWREAIALIGKTPRLRFDLVDLRKMPETIDGQRNPFLDLVVAPNPSGAHKVALDPSWDNFYGKRSSATRRRDRTKLNRLAAIGEVCFVEPQTDHDIRQTLETLFEQKARSFAHMGVRNLFAQPGYRDFYLDIALDPALRQTVHVSRLQVGPHLVATNLGLTLNGCYYYLLASYGDGELARFGPGAAHLRELLRHAIERGFHHFDFTIGDEAYKRDWCDEEMKLYDHSAAATARALPVVLANFMLRGTKRFIKQTPVLWRTVSKARALAGTLRLKVKPPTSAPWKQKHPGNQSGH